MKKQTITHLLIAVLTLTISSCVLPCGTRYAVGIKNDTKDTLYLAITDTAYYEFSERYDEMTLPGDTAIVGGFTSPLFEDKDTCYIVALKWRVAQEHSMDEIRKKKLYDIQPVTKRDFHNGLTYRQ